MEPGYSGCAVLDPRKGDGYTDSCFLRYHIDRNPDIRFSPVQAFYVTGVTDDDLRTLAHLTRLQELRLGHTRVTDSGLALLPCGSA